MIISVRACRLFLLAVTVAICGCGTTEIARQTASGPTVRELASVKSEDGLIHAELELRPAAPRISDNPILTLRIRNSNSISVEKSEFADAIGDFGILDITVTTPIDNPNESVLEYALKLVPRKSGTAELLPIPIHYTEKSDDADASEKPPETRTLILTPPNLEITSGVASKDAEISGIEAKKELLHIHEGLPIRTLLGAAIVVIITLIVLSFLGRIRFKKKIGPIVLLTPKEKALLQLDQLMQSGIYETDIKQFFEKLSGIVRWYIEKTTSFRAKERTTEEFLREISRTVNQRIWGGKKRDSKPETRDNALRVSDKMRKGLAEFLEASDLVKFATFKPPQEDISSSFLIAREFIEHGD